MTILLQDLPFFGTDTTVRVAGANVRIKDNQIIVWVSLAPRGLRSLAPATPRFPAIVDTGNTYNFSIQERHLQPWAGIAATSLPTVRHIGLSGQTGQLLPVLGCNVWLHLISPANETACQPNLLSACKSTASHFIRHGRAMFPACRCWVFGPS